MCWQGRLIWTHGVFCILAAQHTQKAYWPAKSSPLTTLHIEAAGRVRNQVWLLWLPLLGNSGPVWSLHQDFRCLVKFYMLFVVLLQYCQPALYPLAFFEWWKIMMEFIILFILFSCFVHQCHYNIYHAICKYMLNVIMYDKYIGEMTLVINNKYIDVTSVTLTNATLVTASCCHLSNPFLLWWCFLQLDGFFLYSENKKEKKQKHSYKFPSSRHLQEPVFQTFKPGKNIIQQQINQWLNFVFPCEFAEAKVNVSESPWSQIHNQQNVTRWKLDKITSRLNKEHWQDPFLSCSCWVAG